MNFAGEAQLADAFDQDPHGGRADDGIFDQENAFAFEHFSQGGVFGLGFFLPRSAALDKRATAVTVANEAFQAGYVQLICHGVGRGLAGIGHGHDDRILVDGLVFQKGQFLAQGLAGEINAAAVHRAGHVGEIDPLEEAMGLSRAVGESLDVELAVGDGDRLAGQ